MSTHSSVRVSLSMSIKIVLADDSPDFRGIIRSLLEEEPDLKVLGEAEDGEQTIAQVRKLHPDVVVMDIVLPKLNGIESTRRLHTEFPDVRIIALTMYSNKKSVQQMQAAGAVGLVRKDDAKEELVQTLREVVVTSKH